MGNNTSYETQAIDINLLSVLDITKEGKVVSVEKWVELWNLVFQHINKIDAFCVDIQSTLDNWHESEIALNEIIEDMQMKYAALSTEFIHYGENPPENPHIMLWVRRRNDISTHGFLTNEDVDSELSSASENPVQNKVINTALSNKMNKNNPTGTGSFSLNRRANTTVGSNSYAEGYNAEASGSVSHAEGSNTKASSDYQHVQGKYNIPDSNNIYADVIGNGSSDTERSNAYTLDWNGNAWYAGDVYVGSTSGTNKDVGSKKLATEEYTDTQITEKTDQAYSPTSENAQSGKAVAEALSGYVMAEVGKGLSSNDFTNEDKEKLYSALQNENIDKTYNPTSENAQSGLAVAQAVSTEQKRADNTFANALKGYKSGSAILIDDVSPVTHNMGVKISSNTITDLTAVKVIKSNASGEAVAEYTPTADGTVNGVTSLYPNTTLMTDTEGVIIECEYNKDINIVLKHININTWKDVQDTVRAGFGHIRFPVGYEFTTEDSVTGAVITWVVRAHDHHTAANNKLTHTMTLETKNVYSLSSGTQKAVQYDATEAFYYAEQELAAGTYNITIANQTWYPADNGKTFQFTLATAVPVGGQLVFAMTYNATLEGKSVKSYANKTTTTALETVTLTEGSEGTSLGTTNGSSPNVNYMHRAIFGSNNYAQSAVRQWLNSAAVAGSVWTPTNVFDRPASWATSYNGFMHGLPADFLAVVQPAVLACRTNSLFEVESLDGTVFTTNQVYNLAEKFFLLSRPEIFGNWDSESYKDGELLEFYEGFTDTERIKYDAAGTARVAWLRSPYPSGTGLARIVTSSGELDGGNAYSGLGVAPACIIA